MKKIIFLAPFIFMSTLSYSQSQLGRVLSSTPITQTVSVPEQICYQSYVNEPVYNNNSGAAVLGAIAGGLIGNAVGGGHHGYYRNNGAAIVLGSVGGALIGNQISGGGNYVSRPVQTCQYQNTYQQRVVAYEVVYEVNGGTYTTQTTNPPGNYINVETSYTNYNPQVYNIPEPMVYQRIYNPPPVYYAPHRHRHRN